MAICRVILLILWATVCMGWCWPPASQAAVSAATQDWHARLARHWAPAIFQDVDAGGANPLGRYDFLTAADFDGDLAGGNNWENADDSRRSEFPLKPYVYYAVIETETHYYLTYSLFHPRDWRWSALERAPNSAPAAPLTHENDLESATLVILKDGRFGSLRLVGTVCHLDNYCFVAGPDVSVRTWAVDLTGGDAAVRFHQGRLCLFVESGGHGIGGIARALTPSAGGPYAFGDRQYAFRSGAGVAYLCAEDPAYLPEGEPPAGDVLGPVGATSYYQLIPLLDSLWRLSADWGPGLMFDGAFAYRSPQGCGPSALPLFLAAEDQEVGANPPWARDASRDDLDRGVWFLDPAYAFEQYARTWDDAGIPGYHRYLRNDYATGDVDLEVTLPAADRSFIQGYPVRITWRVASGMEDLDDQAGLFLSRNFGRTWTELPVPVSLASGEAVWEPVSPASDRCVLALRAPLACDAALAATGLSRVFSITQARDLAWCRLDGDAPGSPPVAPLAGGVFDAADDRLVVLGGDASVPPVGTSSQVWAFDFAGLAWERLDYGLSEAPPGEGWPALTYDSVRRNLVVCCGSATQDPNAVWMFSLANRTWSRVAASGGDSRSGAAAIFDPASGRLVIFGGSIGDGARNDVRGLILPNGQPGWPGGEMLAPEWETLHPGSGTAPQARTYAAGLYDPAARRLLIHGGRGGQSGAEALADVWAFYLDTGEWVQLDDGIGDCPAPRWHHAGLLDTAGSRLIIYGGQDDDVRRSDAWAFDLNIRQWARLNDGLGAASPGPRSGAAAALRSPGGQMVVCGGSLAGIEPEGWVVDVWSMALGNAGQPPSGRGTVQDTLPIVGPAIWPNPARADVHVSFTLNLRGRVKVGFYDVTGRLVGIAWDGEMPAGVHAIRWNGRDAADREVAEGVYFCRISTEGFTSTRPAVLLR